MTVEDPQSLVLAGLALLAIVYVVRWQTDPLRSIPTVGGPSAPGLSMLAALNYLRNGRKVMFRGYQKYYGSAFKVAQLDKWVVVLCGRKLVDELWRRPDDELSTPAAVQDIVQMRYTLGHEAFDDPYETDIVKEKLTRALPVIFPDVVEEMRLAVSDYIPTKGDEWTPVNGMDTMMKVIARTSGRAFVGLPLCRNEELLTLILRFTMDVVKDRFFLNAFPYFLKPYFGHITDRRMNMQELGDDWSDKPVDMLQWVMEEAIRRKSSDYKVAERIFLVNFAAIHTTSSTIAHALYDLAAMPQLIAELRDEIDSAIASDGWTKAAMGKMWKLDSVCRETLRYHGMSLIGLFRKAVKDITLSDGTFIPKGTTVVAAAGPTHHEASVYPNPEVLDPFRFAKMGADGGEGRSLKHQIVSTSVDFLPFGHGKHACPGRWFAANEVKMILAHIVLNYDLKLGGDGKRPADTFFGATVLPPRGQVFFRKRSAVSGA